MTPITWQAAVDDEEQRPLLQDILEAADDGHHLGKIAEVVSRCLPRGFYPRDAMLARVFAIATCPSVCLSVCPSVCHTPVLCLAERKQDREMYTI